MRTTDQADAMSATGGPGPSGGAAPTPEEPPCDRGLREEVPAGKRRPPAATNRLYLFNGDRPQPVPAHREPVEKPEAEVVGICCSGGGIRSAAFNLGALQALQGKDRLQGPKGARYLAAVSGGSYIAGAFAMVAQTTGEEHSDPELIASMKPFAPGSPEEQYLRNRTDYLAPDGMDKLYLGFRIVLGLLFNTLFIALPFFGVTVLLGLLVYRHAFPELVGCSMHTKPCPRSVELPPWCWLVPVVLAGLSVVLGLALLVLRIKHERHRRALQVWATRLLVVSAGVALMTVALPELVALFHVHGGPSGGTPLGTNSSKPIIGGAAGTAGLLAGITAVLRGFFVDAEKALTRFQKLSAKMRLVVAYVAAALFGPLLLYGVVVFSLSFTLANAVGESERWWLLGGGAGALLLFALLYARVDLMSLSLHPFYRRQISTAFALKRVRATHPADAQQERDGIAVERDYDKLVPLSETALESKGWPTLLVCAAANVSDPGATPPGRRITSFTFSAHTIGGPLVGAIETAGLEKAVDRKHKRNRNLTLPAAIAMSGAALAPSMGKMTQRPLTFLLALANIRLGVWVPNPRFVEGEPGRRTWPRARRRPRLTYLLREMIGRNRVDSHFLFVTDGGHYENLGLVELLRRGCTEIYCFDASGGEIPGALGDAIALARSELGVEIEIDPAPLVMRRPGDGTAQPAGGVQDGAAGISSEEDLAQKSVVTGKFTYRDEHKTPGVLVYARNVMTADSPWDTKAYHHVDRKFPDDTTMDQFYTDQRFESYRVLGQLAGQEAVKLMDGARPGLA
jgi:hypothetical protein